MTRDRKQRIGRLLKYAILGTLLAAVVNRLLAWWAGGDTHLFDLLLVVTCVIIPLAACARILRILRGG
jgi:hypothetical protein